MRQRLHRSLRPAAISAVALCWAALIATRWSDLSAREWRLDAGWTAASVLAFCGYFLALGMGWALLVRAMGYRTPMAAAARSWILSMPARYVPGNIWHIASRVRLAGRHGLSAEAVLVSSTVEQLLTVLSAAALGAAWIPAMAGKGWEVQLLPLAAVALVGLQPPVIRLLLRVASTILRKPLQPIDLGYRRLALLFLWYSLANVLNGAAFCLLFPATGSPLPASFISMVGIYSLAYVVGYASFLTPSGIGVREAVLASMLILAFGMPIDRAVTASLLARILSMAGEAAALLMAELVIGGRLRGAAGISSPGV